MVDAKTEIEKTEKAGMWRYAPVLGETSCTEREDNSNDKMDVALSPTPLKRSESLRLLVFQTPLEPKEC